MFTEAIILKKIPTKDFDELVVCYTQQTGKQSYRAKSAQRPGSKQGRHLDVLNHVTFTAVSGNGHPIIASAMCMDAHRPLKHSLPALGVAFFVLEAFDKLVFDAEYDPELWAYVQETLTKCDALARDASADWNALLRERREALLTVLGHPSHVLLDDLHPKPFSSLRFMQTVLQ